MFLKNCWYVAAWDHDLIDGRMLPHTIQQAAAPVTVRKPHQIGTA